METVLAVLAVWFSGVVGGWLVAMLLWACWFNLSDSSR